MARSTNIKGKIVAQDSVEFSSLTAGTVPVLNGSKQIVSSAVTPTELGNLSGTTSPIQDQLDDEGVRVSTLEDNSKVLTVYAYENNTQVYADGQPGIQDPSALIRDGWYFKNSTAGQKINWYYFDGLNQGTVTLGQLESVYAVMTFDSISAPILAVYTVPTGTGDAIPGFAHSRIVYDGVMSPIPIVGKKYLVYGGIEPSVHPELPRIQLAKVPAQCIGEQLPAEQIFTVSFGSDSGLAVNQVQFMVETLGLFSDPVKHELDLRIQLAAGSVKYDATTSANWTSPTPTNVRAALDSLAANKISTSQIGAANGVAPLNSSSKIDSTYLPAYVDDVLEFANLAAFPVTGSTGIIYVALDTNLCYRWSGSTYIEISPAPVTSVNGQTNAVSLDALDIPFTPTATITSTNVQAAIEEVEASSAASTAAIFEDTREPTGFINRTDSTISFVDGTRIFTIAPVSTSFSFYIKGEKFTKTTAQSITIPNLTGTHYIYFNTSGALETTQVPSADIFEIDAIIAFVYWNNETNLSTLFGEERHGITMDGATHSYLHTILGARYLSGLALQNFTIGSGNNNADAQFTSDEGSIRDEDILHTIPAQTQIPILYRQGQYWRRKVADAYPLIYSGSAGYTGANGRPAYNQYTGGAWQLTEMTNTDFILVHFFGTNDVNNKVIGVVGTQQYASRSAARTGANSEISKLQDLPFTEFVPIGTVIFQSNNYTNAVKARVVTTDLGQNYVDFRGTQVYTPAGEASDHGLLSGLVDDDHIQYHTDARGDIRYYTKAQVDSLISGISSAGDIDQTAFSINNSQSLPANVTGFAFAAANVRGFNALISVSIDATSDLFETFELVGVNKSGSFEMSISSVGDDSGVTFSITSAGQVQYTSANYTGFVSGVIKFRAITTTV
jgi:hypothetical protein